MITKEKLSDNLDILRNTIPKKPKIYTSDHPKNIKEALYKYSNRRSVHGMEMCALDFHRNNWPLTLWYDPENIKVGFWNKLFYKKWYNSFRKTANKNHSKKKKRFKKFKDYEYFWIPFLNKHHFKRGYDTSIVAVFEVNKKYILSRLTSNHIIESKKNAISEIFSSLEKKLWQSSINTIFPIIDYVARKLLNTTRLNFDVSKICKLFEQNGFSVENLDYLMPHAAFVNAMDYA